MRIVTEFYVDAKYMCTHVTEFPNIGGMSHIPLKRFMTVNICTSQNTVLVGERCTFPPDENMETHRVDINSVHIQYLSSAPKPVLGLEPVDHYQPKHPCGGLGYDPPYLETHGTSIPLSNSWRIYRITWGPACGKKKIIPASGY